jgi:AraC-like DNA-binding protein
MGACSIASEEAPILVNCAGRIVANDPFVTDNTGGREDYYLIYVERGELTVFLNGNAVTARSGSAVLFPPRSPYKYTFDGNAPLSYLWAHFTGSYAARFLDECGFFPLPCLLPSKPNIRVVSAFEELFDVFSTRAPLQKQKLACRLEDVLLRVATGSGDEDSARSLAKSLGYIHSFYNKELRIPTLARMESLSNSRYITRFKERMGMPPSEYIIDLRINVACDLLKNHDMSVKEVAACVGYDNPCFFSKLFKEKTGRSPKSYKEGAR